MPKVRVVLVVPFSAFCANPEEYLASLRCRIRLNHANFFADIPANIWRGFPASIPFQQVLLALNFKLSLSQIYQSSVQGKNRPANVVVLVLLLHDAFVRAISGSISTTAAY